MLTDGAHIRHASSPTLASHSPVHNELLMYRELTKWLKECQPEILSEVIDVSYIVSILDPNTFWYHLDRLILEHSVMCMMNNSKA